MDQASMQAESSSERSERLIKRKFEDAIHSLDEAVGSSTSLHERPPPAKRQNTGRSIYSTLAKYGIKTTKETQAATTPSAKFDKLSKTAPHLAAILSRTATRTRKALPFKFSQPSAKTTLSPSRSFSEYRPSSTTSFLGRLATFKLTTYANKPSAIDAVAAAKCGWVNEGKDRLLCGICDASWIVVGKEGMSRDAANALIEKQRVSLIEGHKNGCPWKTRQCEASIYQVPLQTPLAMAREVKSQALKLDPIMHDVQVRHPLSVAQVQSLLSTIRAVRLPDASGSFSFFAAPQITEGTELEAPMQADLPSENAILASLFGWAVLPPAPTPERTSTPSISRASSAAPRASSVAPSFPSTPSRSRPGVPEGTPLSVTPRIPHVRSESVASGVLSSSARSRPDTTLLHCSLCQRRVGLWAFIPSSQPEPSTSEPSQPGEAAQRPPPQRRQFDVLKEHRSYCPYVVRSTVIPTLSPSAGPFSSTVSIPLPPSNPSLTQVNAPPGAIEGWRAVLAVVLRYGTAQRQRLGRIPSERRVGGEGAGEASADAAEAETAGEMNQVEAMVAGVKSRGGRDLLKYVKGLLG